MVRFHHIRYRKGCGDTTDMVVSSNEKPSKKGGVVIEAVA